MSELHLDHIYLGNNLDVLRELPAQSVHCCVTSPPYYGLRDYGHPDQLGLEATPDEYAANLVRLFTEVHRVLRDDGTLWLNLGDSYAGSWGNYSGGKRGTGEGQREIITGSLTQQRAYDGLEHWRPPTSFKLPGIKNKDLIGVPWLVAFALRAAGWYLRQDIVWHKPNPLPESTKDRCTKAHEYIFLFSKQERYYFDYETIRETAVGGQRGKAASFKREGSKREQVIPGQTMGTHRPDRPDVSYDGELRHRRSVWTVNTRPYREAHFATFPTELIEPCVLAGCPPQGVVLDPFMGSGTTAVVATAHDRRYVGIELNQEYVELAERRVQLYRLAHPRHRKLTF